LQPIFLSHPIMSPSRDIKALFDRFGGDPDSYREIRMEGEAHEARGRWPLLGMIDPRKVGLSAVETPRGAEPAKPEVEQAAPGRYEGVQSSLAAGGGLLPRDRSQAALRRSAPLFTRSPRRDIPPVLEKSAPRAPESGAFRFSPLPAAGEPTDEAAQQEQHLAGAVKRPQSHEPRVAARVMPPVPPVPPAVNAALEPGVAAQGVARAGPSASSPLKKLFGTAAPSTQGTAQAPDSESSGRLDRLFDRLRSGGGVEGARSAARVVEPTTAATPRQPWFPKGASRP
jgi:resuscitation-promoting factor RpfA